MNTDFITDVESTLTGVIRALNVQGYTTSGSCEGHSNVVGTTRGDITLDFDYLSMDTFEAIKKIKQILITHGLKNIRFETDGLYIYATFSGANTWRTRGAR